MTDRELDALVLKPAELITTIRANEDAKAKVQARLAHYKAMDRAGRLAGCWISRKSQQVMQSALDAANQPSVSEGV